MNAGLDLLSHTALKGSAVLLAALVAGLVLRRLAASRRYTIWMMAMLALAVLPLAMVLLPAWRVIPKSSPPPDWMVLEPEEVIEPMEEPVKGFAAAEPVVPAMTVTAAMPPPEPARPLWTWHAVIELLPMVWLGVAALMLARLWWSAMRLGRLQRRLTAGACEEIAAVARELGLKRVPRLLVGAADAVPMVWGVSKSCLLLPRGFESWSADKLRGVLLHELAHLKRRDPLALWTAQWVKALHWFNPLAWLTIRQLRADQERACDDAVLRQGVRPSDYAQSLLDLSRHSRIAPGLALCALTITRCAPVEARVNAILDPNRRREPITRRWLACLAGFALLITLPVAMLHAIEGPKLRGRILDRNGVVLAESTKEKLRTYPLKTLAAHTLGYTGKTSVDDPTPQGRAGVEKQHDAVLKAGDDVTLSLDMRIQSLVHRAMTEAGVERGATVVLDPRTGAVLAMVSLPSYDLNAFIPTLSKEDWESYLADRDMPLFDRCAVGQFAPGSAFMPLTALAGISAGVGNRSFECEGEMKIGNKNYLCWIHRQNGKGHGKLGMTEAIANTCNCFWYQFGIATRPEAIGKVGGMIGLGQPYGILEKESEGILPVPAWLAEKRPRERWSDGQTANLAIGQGMTLVTPLQLAVLAATIGNAGRIPQPKVLAETKTTWRADLVAEGLSESQIAALREGMRQVVQDENGTGRSARSDKVVIAGKTGTAQNWRRIDDKRVEDNNVWFIGFAPFESPTLAFAILKQGGKSGGHDCAPIARRIVEETLALPADGSGEVILAKEAVGVEKAKLKQARARFDARGAEISSAIKLAQESLGNGLLLKESKIGNGRLILLGEAAGMIQALQFRDKLIKAGESWEVEWTFPVPRTLKDNQRVEFRIEAVYLPGVSAEPDTPPVEKPKTTSILEGDILMDPMLARSWALLKKKGLLADLPPDAVIPSEVSGWLA